jgi:hypothetical protein
MILTAAATTTTQVYHYHYSRVRDTLSFGIFLTFVHSPSPLLLLLLFYYSLSILYLSLFTKNRYFKLGKLSSFQRQLNLYGYSRITRGRDATGYYHEFFLRHREYLAHRILRQRIKGTKIKGATNPELEPNFYAMVSTTS